MFPLTDLSILFAALLIIAVLCVGLLVLLGMCISRCRQYVPTPQNRPAEQPVAQRQVMDADRLDEIRRETRFGTTLALWGIGLAIIIYAVNALPTNVMSGIAGIILSGVLYWLGRQDARQWIHSNRGAANIVLFFVIGVVGMLVVLSVIFPIRLAGH